MSTQNRSKTALLLKIFVLVTLFAAAGTPAWSQSEESPFTRSDLLYEDPVNHALAMQSYEDMWQHLSESGVTWIRTAAALHFMAESDPDLKAQGENLASEILAGEPRDAHTLWLLFNVCDTSPEIPGCSATNIGARLIESDPDNAAVYLKVAGFGVSLEPEGILDTSENRQALLRASRANSIDIYYGHDALQLYRLLVSFEAENQPTHEPAMDLAPHSRASGYTWTVNMLQPLGPFLGLTQLCESQVAEARMNYVNACLSLARNMQAMGKSLITRSVGYALERRLLQAMGADTETILYLYRKGRMSTHVAGCQLPTRMKTGKNWREPEESEVIAYFSDLGTLGEVAAIRNTAIRGFETNPEDFEQDPLACEALMDLDSESMGLVLGTSDPKGRLEQD